MQELFWVIIRLKRKFVPFLNVGKLPFVRGLPRYFQQFLRRSPVRVQGRRMYLDAEDTLELGINGIYEPELTEFFKRVLTEGDTVLDIGAHIGYYTLLFSGLVGEKGRVFAFEPNPVNSHLLGKNVSINGLRNVELSDKAVSDVECEMFMYESGSNSGDHRVYDPGEARNKISIRSVVLDSYTPITGRGVKLIKMDIQGAEYKALKGMAGVIGNNEDIILSIEFWPYGLKLAGASAAIVLETLEDFGFTIYELKGSLLIKSDPPSILIENYSSDDPSAYTNCVCLKGCENLKFDE